jgi:hypothetical protein
MSDEPLYYIQDRRTIVGNCVSWWRPNGAGYTTELDEAGLYPASKGKGLRETDVMVPKEVAERVATRHVRAERLRESLGGEVPKV